MPRPVMTLRWSAPATSQPPRSFGSGTTIPVPTRRMPRKAFTGLRTGSEVTDGSGRAGAMVMELRRKISRTLRAVTFAATILLVASAQALAQNLPPPGAYQPIPNFTGVGAGLQFREAINDRFSGAQPIATTLVPVTAAQLAAVPAINGGLLYCSNCHGNSSCSSGGNGSVAFGMGGDWNCNLANAGGLNSVSNDTNVTGALSSGGTVLSLGWNGILPGSRGGTGCGAPVTFSALPGSPVTGTTCTITDAPSCVVGTA